MFTKRSRQWSDLTPPSSPFSGTSSNLMHSLRIRRMGPVRILFASFVYRNFSTNDSVFQFVFTVYFFSLPISTQLTFSSNVSFTIIGAQIKRFSVFPFNKQDAARQHLQSDYLHFHHFQLPFPFPLRLRLFVYLLCTGPFCHFNFTFDYALHYLHATLTTTIIIKDVAVAAASAVSREEIPHMLMPYMV